MFVGNDLSREPVLRGRVCITGATNYYAVVWHFDANVIALVHGKNGWIGEQAISRGHVCIKGDKKYYAVVLHFVYNIFICIYL